MLTGPTVLVLGCGDVGSAVAHQLFRREARTVLCNLARSAHSRRGMAFTDALFEGEARLDGVVARLVASVEACHDAWLAAKAIPVVTLSEPELVRALHFDAAVDATMRKHQVPRDRRPPAALTVGLGPGFTPGVNCHMAIETQWGAALGEVLRDRGTAALTGGPHWLGSAGSERFVSAPVSGLWRTAASIGQQVLAGEIVGTIDAAPVRASLRGCLRGLTHHEVTVAAGQKLVEVDPREPPRVFGLGERPRAVAEGVCRALGLE